jgi:lipopolysaccharide/colanic/teichoic acid biosynthesis glycosyltransferase
MSFSIQLETLLVTPAQAERGSAGAALKRALDVVSASILLVLTAPVFLLVALAVSMDGGPPSCAPRVGRDGKSFGCLKFRSMVVGAEEALSEYLALHPEAAEQWQREQKLGFDPRITGIGKLLRRTSLDELPQLVNVLRGEMSLVGPRPVTERRSRRSTASTPRSAPRSGPV